MSASGVDAALELRGIDKRFGAIHANRAVSLKLARGSIHGLVGENGAGKSTLAHILYGTLRPDAGEILIGGEPVQFRNTRDAIRHRIGMVHQHFMLVEPMSVAENLMLGREDGPLLGFGREAAMAALGRLAPALDPETPVEHLAVGLRQRVEIVKALHRGAEILILDEPTAVLTPLETAELFEEMRALASDGSTILLVTHKLKEVMAVTDRVTVLRQGSVVAEHETRATSVDALAAAMIGRQPEAPVRTPARAGAPVLTATDLAVAGRDGSLRLDGVTLAVHAGEILGVAGVAGNGQTELIEALTGLAAVRGGRVALNGEDITGLSVGARRRRGLGHIAEDRLRFGAVAEFSAAENALLGRQSESEFSRGGWLRRDAVLAALTEWMRDYDIRPPDPGQRLAAFSGGNQQKLVVAREIERRPAALVIGQPTRGVDIGASELIHRRLLALRAAGAAILLVSADLDEIRLLADRILVLCNGRITGELSPAEADERRLGLLMAGATAA